MEKPKKCDLCGTEHHPHQAHRFVNSVNSPVNTEVNKLRGLIAEKDAEIARLRAELDARMGRVTGATDRKAYMREYMRKRRSK